MTTLLAENTGAPAYNPVDLLEQIFSGEEWPYERMGEDEVSAAVPGSWSEYHLRFIWRPDEGILQVLCAFELKVPPVRRAAVYETLALVNERMWLGHFELWADDGTILFRNAAYLGQDADGIAIEHAELLIQSAVSDCERFYPVFQFVIWADRKPQEAIEAAMLETVGEA